MSSTPTQIPPNIEQVKSINQLEPSVSDAPSVLVDPSVVVEEEYVFIKHRLFLNNLDYFNAVYIASYLRDQIYGASRLEFGDEAGGEASPVVDTPRDEEKFNYEIVGITQFSFGKLTEDMLMKINEENPEEFRSEILKCGIIVYDITQDESSIQKALDTLAILEEHIEKIKDVGPKTFANYPNQRIFILISTVMTWGKTKPPRDPTVSYTEAQYKKRKPHPNYESHIACEREVVLKGRNYPDYLKTYVLCSGIIYGQEEVDFSTMFKLAWMNEQYLPLFSGGTNYIPVIHIGDLARVLHKLIEINPGTPQYILAVEQNPVTLKKIVVALSKAMGNGRTKFVTKEEAFLYDEFPQKIFERLTVNLKMEPEFALDALQVEWQSELNMVENMKRIAAEFSEKNKLVSKKIVLHGPPAVGKTKLAKALVEKYGLHYISVKTLIEESLESLSNQITDEKARLRELEERAKDKEIAQAVDDDENVDDEEAAEEEEEGGNIEDWEEEIREITAAMESSENKKLPDEIVARLLRRLLTKNVCQYRGVVLDGYPKTYEQAKEIFGQSGEIEGGEEGGAEEEFGDMIGNASNKLLPHYIVSLQATDDFLCERIINLPESEVQGTHYNEEGMLRRLAEFRANNTEDNTMLNFFDEIEIHPIVINIENTESNQFSCILDYVCKIIGPPAKLKLSPQEDEELHKMLMMKTEMLKEEKALQKKMLENRCQLEFQDKMEEWTDLLHKYEIEEEKLLAAKAEPLRFYLMKYVFPVLINGLVETAKIKPNDPVDFLAEYLFKENPEGKMFDPSFTSDGEQLQERYDRITSVLDENTK